MPIVKKKNFLKSENIYENKRYNGYNQTFSAKITKKIFKFILVILFYNSISFTEEKNSIMRQIDNISEIIMVIDGMGGKKILGDNFNDFPSEVYINGVLQPYNRKIYNFNSSDNSVRLIFKNKIISCANMFNGVQAKKIDLSNFDSSLITNMERMFYNCQNLLSLDLSGLQTSGVLNMENMFYGCSKLSFLNLSNFDTSSVQNMDFMFYTLKYPILNQKSSNKFI